MTNKIAKKTNEEFGAALYQAAVESRQKKMTEQVVIQVEHWLQNKQAAEIKLRETQKWIDELTFKLKEIEAGRFDLNPENGNLTLHRKFVTE